MDQNRCRSRSAGVLVTSSSRVGHFDQSGLFSADEYVATRAPDRRRKDHEMRPEITEAGAPDFDVVTRTNPEMNSGDRPDWRSGEFSTQTAQGVAMRHFDADQEDSDEGGEPSQRPVIRIHSSIQSVKEDSDRSSQRAIHTRSSPSARAREMSHQYLPQHTTVMVRCAESAQRE